MTSRMEKSRVPWEILRHFQQRLVRETSGRFSRKGGIEIDICF